MQNCFNSLYSARKVISEIQIMRKLSEQSSNHFITRIYDLIMPEIDLKSDEAVDYIIIVMEYVETDLFKMFE